MRFSRSRVANSPKAQEEPLLIREGTLSASDYYRAAKKWWHTGVGGKEKRGTTDWYCQGLLLKDNRNSEQKTESSDGERDP